MQKQRRWGVQWSSHRDFFKENFPRHFSFYYVYPINYCQSEVIWNDGNKEGEREREGREKEKKERLENHSNKLFITHHFNCSLIIVLIDYLFIARATFPELLVFPRAFSPCRRFADTVSHSNYMRFPIQTTLRYYVCACRMWRGPLANRRTPSITLRFYSIRTRYKARQRDSVSRPVNDELYRTFSSKMLSRFISEPAFSFERGDDLHAAKCIQNLFFFFNTIARSSL